jgi:BirA family biotin operon repressor/biotin-[acetyl-CoA-carboxylase] ligase
MESATGYLPLDIKKVSQSAETRIVASRFYYYPAVQSTSDIALELAEQGAFDGSIVVTDYQKAGRGSKKRNWVSPANRNLLFSMILRLGDKKLLSPQITMMACVAVYELLSIDYQLPAVIKWPNDVLVGGKKICGILTETKTRSWEMPYLVTGIGLNVNMAREDFPEGLQNRATSLSLEKGGMFINREECFTKLLLRLDKWTQELLSKGMNGIIAQWNDASDIVGKLVQVQDGDISLQGYVMNIDVDGGLLIREISGTTSKILSGEITRIY